MIIVNLSIFMIELPIPKIAELNYTRLSDKTNKFKLKYCNYLSVGYEYG